MNILGINCYHNFASASLVDEERIVASVEEERLSRVRYDGSFPERSINACLEIADIEIGEIDHVAFYYNPWLGLGKRAFELLKGFPGSLGGAVGDYGSEWFKIARVERQIRRRFRGRGRKPRFRFHWVDHYVAHAASCFLLSPFERAAILCIDGNGEESTTWLGIGEGARMTRIAEVPFPHSLGLLYATVTEYLGYLNNAHEGKVMGLAPYGKPVHIDAFREIVRWIGEGQFRLDLSYFLFHRDTRRWFSPRFEERFGPARGRDDPLEDHHADIAATAQLRTEEIGLALARELYEQAGTPNLCLAGGVVLNSVMNGRIQRETRFENLFIQPAANDAGTSLGAALHVRSRLLPDRIPMDSVYLGTGVQGGAVEAAAKEWSLPERTGVDPIEEAARLLDEGAVVGWFHGRMEIGPRALGNRSILADPRRADMKDRINHKIKKRESYRPFAPVVLEEKMGDWFESDVPSPHMLQVVAVREDRRDQIPAVTHVDGTARLQTVRRQENPAYYGIVEAFEKRTGVPVLLNTSFNWAGQPMVHTASEAARTFVESGMDWLVMEGRLFGRPAEDSGD